jgi:hypothetical protein
LGAFLVQKPKKCDRKFIQKSIAEKHGNKHPITPKMEPKSMPKLIQNQCQNWYRKRSGKSGKFMFFLKGKTLILSAEHSSVVQKQGSRGFVRGECANGKIIKKT